MSLSSVVSTTSRSESSMEELRNERSLLSSVIVIVFRDIEPLSANALSFESSSDDLFNTDELSSLLWLVVLWCRFPPPPTPPGSPRRL